ncbi:Holliday junction branch migration protein RuvA [Patescibacteria group bacterium]|nr:Holliday junction branch migration protein RuvA [Patescibacteria group bacterium]
MISYLEGKIIFKGEKFIILDVNGVGYKVFLSQKVLPKISQKDKELNPVRNKELNASTFSSPRTSNEVKIFCYLNVKENALDLYGFLTHKELEFFETLIDIRSIGPKAALEIASIAPMEKIKEAIESEDEEIVRELFNVGKKKAQLLILELSKKIKEKPKEKSVSGDEAFRALVNLGFSRDKVKSALGKVSKEIQGSEKKVKEALKILGE